MLNIKSGQTKTEDTIEIIVHNLNLLNQNRWSKIEKGLKLTFLFWTINWNLLLNIHQNQWESIVSTTLVEQFGLLYKYARVPKNSLKTSKTRNAMVQMPRLNQFLQAFVSIVSIVSICSRFHCKLFKRILTKLTMKFFWRESPRSNKHSWVLTFWHHWFT